MKQVLVVFLLAVAGGSCQVIGRCQLVQDLLGYGIPKSDMSNWICLIEAESSRNTKAIHHNTDGSTDYGLFQINSHYWCNEGSTPGKTCDVTCSALLSDDIGPSVNCALIVKRLQGWAAWYGWQYKCQGALPDFTPCY